MPLDLTNNPSSVWRRNEVLGDSSSPIYEPPKSEIITLFDEVISAVEGSSDAVGGSSLSGADALRAFVRPEIMQSVTLKASETGRDVSSRWNFDPLDTSTSDDGFTTIVGADGARWKRQSYDINYYEELLKRAIVRLAATTGPILVVAAGQSNMGGSNNDNSGDSSTNAGVFMFNWSGAANPAGDNTWIPSQPGVFPMANEGSNPSNIAHWFCRRLREETGRLVYLVLRFHGSTDIVEWTPGFQEFDRFVALDGHVTDALQTPEMAGKTHADVVLWHQGENDTDAGGNTTSNYRTQFIEVYNRFRFSDWCGTNTPFISGELAKNTNFDDRNDVISNLHRSNLPYVITAKSDDLQIDSSGNHFTGAALKELGYNRYFDAYLRFLLSPPAFERQGIAADPNEFGYNQPLATDSARDLLQDPSNGGLALGASVFTEMEGLLGFRVGQGPGLAPGSTAPSRSSGAAFFMLGNVTLPNDVPRGYVLTLIATGASQQVMAPAGGSINGSASYTLAANSDAVTLVCNNPDSGSEAWFVISSHKS